MLRADADTVGGSGTRPAALVARSMGAAAGGWRSSTSTPSSASSSARKIGPFQAIQHKLANCLIGIEITRLSIYRAASEVGTARDYARAAAAATAGQTLRGVVMELHHGFGGISFWDNHEMPRHFRRIHSDLTRLGGPYAARREVAGFLFDATA